MVLQIRKNKSSKRLSRLDSKISFMNLVGIWINEHNNIIELNKDTMKIKNREYKYKLEEDKISFKIGLNQYVGECRGGEGVLIEFEDGDVWHKGLDGVWMNKYDFIIEINDYEMIINGKSFDFFIENDKLVLTVEDERHVGELTAPDVIEWNDGDIWKKKNDDNISVEIHNDEYDSCNCKSCIIC